MEEINALVRNSEEGWQKSPVHQQGMEITQEEEEVEEINNTMDVSNDDGDDEDDESSDNIKEGEIERDSEKGCDEGSNEGIESNEIDGQMKGAIEIRRVRKARKILGKVMTSMRTRGTMNKMTVMKNWKKDGKFIMQQGGIKISTLGRRREGK